MVYQRAYSICRSTNNRYILTTGSIAPCICVLVYKPNTQPANLASNAVAALAHFDKDQDYTSLNAILDLADFAGPDDVQIHFYGGAPGRTSVSYNTINGLLTTLYKHNARHGRFILAAFDVLRCPHNSDFSFDVRTGRKYTIGGNFACRGFWLDSSFRFWPEGRYMAIADSSNLAVTAEQQGDVTKAYLKQARLQWTGGADAPEFHKHTNELICHLVMEEVRLVLQPRVTLADDLFQTCKTLLIERRAPMTFEQSLKNWIMFKESKAPTIELKNTADTSIIRTMADLCKGSSPPSNPAIATAIDKWVKVDFNAEYREFDRQFP
jgi:hypothetical protein